MSYADGKTETKTVHIESAATSSVSFSYVPASPQPPSGSALAQNGFVRVPCGNLYDGLAGLGAEQGL